MSEVRPPPGSLAAKNSAEAAFELVRSKLYNFRKREELARLLVNRFYPGNKFNDLTDKQQDELRIIAARVLKKNGGKRRTRRRKSRSKRRHTSLKRK